MKTNRHDPKFDIDQVVHEIGNPLNSMLTTVQLMERHVQSRSTDEFTISSLFDLKSEISRLQSLLSDLRSGFNNRTQFRTAELNEIVVPILRMQHSEFDTHKIQVVEQFAAGLPSIRADETRFQQALLNLLKNSIEAMPDGGTLTLAAFQDGQNVVLEISDTGTGMPTGVEAFEPGETTKAGGMGLGLFIVNDIIAAHGGSIAYDTVQGEGTTFRLSLPALCDEKKSKKRSDA